MSRCPRFVVSNLSTIQLWVPLWICSTTGKRFPRAFEFFIGLLQLGSHCKVGWNLHSWTIDLIHANSAWIYYTTRTYCNLRGEHPTIVYFVNIQTIVYWIQQNGVCWDAHLPRPIWKYKSDRRLVGFSHTNLLHIGVLKVVVQYLYVRFGTAKRVLFGSWNDWDVEMQEMDENGQCSASLSFRRIVGMDSVVKYFRKDAEFEAANQQWSVGTRLLPELDLGMVRPTWHSCFDTQRAESIPYRNLFFIIFIQASRVYWLMQIWSIWSFRKTLLIVCAFDLPKRVLLFAVREYPEEATAFVMIISS